MRFWENVGGAVEGLGRVEGSGDDDGGGGGGDNVGEGVVSGFRRGGVVVVFDTCIVVGGVVFVGGRVDLVDIDGRVLV